jgi:hypothetical protein
MLSGIGPASPLRKGHGIKLPLCLPSSNSVPVRAGIRLIRPTEPPLPLPKPLPVLDSLSNKPLLRSI